MFMKNVAILVSVAGLMARVVGRALARFSSAEKYIGVVVSRGPAGCR